MDILQKTVIAFFPMAVSFCLQIVGYEKSQGLFPGFFMGGYRLASAFWMVCWMLGINREIWAIKNPHQAGCFFADLWCPRRDLNPHTSRHMDLNHARLPIPPRGHFSRLSVLQCRTRLLLYRLFRLCLCFSSAIDGNKIEMSL